jgi:hypothetical protein
VRIDPGTTVRLRTNEPISVNRVDGQVFTAVVDQDVLDANGRLVVPRGSTAELVVRTTQNNQLAVDIDSIVVNGQRYGLGGNQNIGTTGSFGGYGRNQRTGAYLNGGVPLGTIVGSSASSGRFSGNRSQIVTQGRSIAVPSQSFLTYRLNREIAPGVPDNGYTQGGRHYHSVDQFGNPQYNGNNPPYNGNNPQYNGNTTGFGNAQSNNPTASAGFSSTINVRGNQQWTSTNIAVLNGDVLHFQASGSVQFSPDPADRAEPQGAANRHTVAGSPMPNQPGGALIARIDNGQPFFIGNQSTVTMPANGTLYLGINDDNVGDNNGDFNVVVSR